MGECLLCMRYRVVQHIGGRDPLQPQAYLELEWLSRLDLEQAILRSLFDEIPTATRLAFVGLGKVGSAQTKVVRLPWRPRYPYWTEPPTQRQFESYLRRRKRFLSLQGQPGWDRVAVSMRRFSVAWENVLLADLLADLVSALESLLVQSDKEVSYKLRVRAGALLSSSLAGRAKITSELTLAYGYRSKIYHGDFVFDDPAQWKLAEQLKRARGKAGNRFHDVNEVRRLVYVVAGYYRGAISKLIDQSTLERDWRRWDSDAFVTGRVGDTAR